MKYRLVKNRDLNRIVNLHYAVKENHPIGIFSKLDRTFLKQYYRILINDVNSLIVCAEDSKGEIQGFCSSSLDVEKQFSNLKKRKYHIALSAIPSVFKNPKIVFLLISRYKSLSKDEIGFVFNTGARLEYWVWAKDNADSVSSILMHEVLLNIILSLGVKKVGFEVDTYNKNVLKFHKLNGAEELKRIVLEDNRMRVLLQYSFESRVSKVKLYKHRKQ